jgi:hypothetical protein
MDIVTERFPAATAERGFDVIVATNVLVYYDRFEQALALANVAAMLAPGGVFLTNYRVSPSPPLDPTPRFEEKVFWDDKGRGDTIYAYRKRVTAAP